MVEWDGSVEILETIHRSLVLVCQTSVQMVVQQDALAASSAAAPLITSVYLTALMDAVLATMEQTAVLEESLDTHTCGVITITAGTSR